MTTLKTYAQFFAVAVTAAIAGIAISRGLSSASAQTDGFSEGQTRAIEKVIKDYLVANPEVMFEVQEALEKKTEAKRAEASKTRMPEFYKDIDGLKAQLAGFTVGEGDVTMVEFFDYNCGYCSRALPDVLKLVDGGNKTRGDLHGISDPFAGIDRSLEVRYRGRKSRQISRIPP